MKRFKFARACLSMMLVLSGAGAAAATEVTNRLAQAKTTGFEPPAPAAARPQASVVRVLLGPAGETTLSSPISGRIKAVSVELGAAFTAGQVLVSLECDEATARLNMAKAELDASVDQHEAKLRMQGLGQTSDVEVSLAASTVAKNRAQLALQKAQVEQCTLKAPWAGRVSRVTARNFMAITPGSPLLELVKSGNLKLRLNVPSAWLAWVKPGVAFTIQVDETGKTYPAKVVLINSRVDAVSQTIELEGALSAAHVELLPGMSGTANFPQAKL